MDGADRLNLPLPAGDVTASLERDLLVLRGLPYAQPPVADRRFAAPTPQPRWSGVRDCTRHGGIAPQGPSRLGAITGEVEGEPSEDCLSLTVWAPAAKAPPRPVMVWVHGGAYLSGAGSLGCYSGDALARNGDVLVVAPNFRIGALGFLYLPGVSSGNLGLQDLVLALRWVRENIAALGGDPERVTVFGQSSGASCIRSLMAMPAARDLFQAAILQSAPLGRGDRTPAQAREFGERYAALLGVEAGDRAAFLQLPVAPLIAAQGQLARSLPAPLGASELPFVPVVDGEVLHEDAGGNWFAAGAPNDRRLLMGFNAQEMAVFHHLDPAVQAAGLDAPAKAQLCDRFTAQLFAAPAIAFGESMAARGVRTWLYRFDWPSPHGLGACHCLELPFVFHNLPRWRGAAMIEGCDAAGFQALADRMQRAWTAFARTGQPDHDRLPHWPALKPQREMMVFDTVPHLQAVP